MVERIDGGGIARQLDPQLQSDAVTPRGQLRGQEVTKEKSIASLVQDSLEELTFDNSASVQITSADVEDVVVEDLSASIEARIKKYTKLRDELEGARGGLDPEKLRQILAALRAGKVSSEEVIDQVMGQFGDVTDQYAALEAVLAEPGRRRGDRELKQAVKKASDTLWEQHATEIVAGLNAAPVAQRFAYGDVEQFQALREAYRSQVAERPTVLQSLRQLRERFGDRQLEERIRFLIAAAGHDLDALVSSVDKEQLGEVVADLSRLQLIGSLRSQAGTIVARLGKRFRLAQAKKDWDILQDSLELMEDKWVGAQKLQALGTGLAPRDLECQIYFLRELNAFFRNIPVKAYSDLDGRERLLDASQAALDQVIEREEGEA